MESQRQTCRRLHDEHEAVFGLLRRLENALLGARGDAQPAFLEEGAWKTLLREVRNGLEFEVAPHFEFEERSLFPVLTDAGEGEMVEMLNADHVVIRGVTAPLLELIGRAQGGKLDAPAWESLKRLGLELCACLAEHAQKEEQAMLPALENALSEDQDRELFAAYAGAEAASSGR